MNFKTIALALAFLVAHLRDLPRTLEDLDSINFALGVESFSVAAHRPHPPGYPIFIGLAKLSSGALEIDLPDGETITYELSVDGDPDPWAPEGHA